MTRVLVVGEDDLTCTLGERIVASLLPTWTAASPTVNAGGRSKLVTALPRYNQFAQHVAHVVCIADSDGNCPAGLLLDWFPSGHSSRLLVRLAVPEAESWALGDRRAVADYFRVPLNIVPRAPDDLGDAKREMLRILKRSRLRQFRDEMVSSLGGQDRPGVGYNVHLRQFIQTRWDVAAAEQGSPSLRRAMGRVRALA